MTFGIVSGVKLKQFDWVVWKTVHVDSVLQHNDDPGTESTKKKKKKRQL